MTQLARFLTVFSLLSFPFLFSFSENAFAAKIVKVTGNKVLVLLENENFKQGDVLYTIDAAGKKRGLIKLMRVKGNRGIAKLGAGKALPGFKLALRPAKTAGKGKTPPKSNQQLADTEASDEPSTPSGGRSYWGLMAGFAQNTMTVDLQSGDTVDLSGSGSSIKVLFDYPIFTYVWFRSMFGMENFSTSSSDEICGDGADKCEVNISYLTLDLWGRYMFNPEGGFRFWVGGGFDLLFPMSDDATAIESTSITNTSLMAVGLGFDIAFGGGKHIIPVHAEYGLYPSSSEVEASAVAVRLGYALNF